MILAAGMLITRCALTLLVMDLLVLPLAAGSPLALLVNLVGIVISLSLIALVALVARWDARRAR